MILAHEHRLLRVVELAEESDWSAAQAAKVLKAFDGQGWTVKQGALRGPGAQPMPASSPSRGKSKASRS